LQLSHFSASAWFKTSSNFDSDAFLVDKGGIGNESSGQNMNYGIWMNTKGSIIVGFGAVGEADHDVTSPNTYNYGQWYHAIVTNEGSNVMLY
jgi:hypothetical protein